jgi:hypothetical protein
MRRPFVLRALLTLLLIVGGAAASTAQELSGYVKDPSGGVLPGATVTATQVGTQLTRVAVTNEQGYYVLPEIPIGEYEVVAELQGFKRHVETGVIVRVNSKATANATLEIGGLEETVTVQADAPLIELSTGEIGRLVTGEQARNLQLNGRNFSQLLWLNPGVSSTARSGTELFGGFGTNMTGQSINGGRTTSQSWNIDGVDNKDNGGGGNNFININPDAIAEFKVLTTNFSAENGQNAGAVINIALKSGTQQFHGAGYEYLRNDSFDSTAFNATVKPKLDYNNFGGNIGGPIAIGGFNENKTKLFFFGGVDFKRQTVGTPTFWTVPTDAQRNGDFSALPSAQWPVDPRTGQAFPGGIIPGDRMSANGRLLVNNYPLPNFTGAGGNFQFNNEIEQNVDQYYVKFDYVQSANSQFSVNYLRDSFFGVQNTTQLATYDRHIPGYSSAVRWKLVLGSNAVNTLQISASGNRIRQDNFQANGTFGRDIVRGVGHSGVTYPLLFGASDKVPSLTISGFQNLTNTVAVFQNFNHLFQLKDDFSKIAGNHTLKAGFVSMRSRKNQDNQPAINGTFAFDSLGQALLGDFNNYTEGGRGVEGWFRFWQHEAYIQDSWKVSQRLSLDLGVRYALYQPQYSALDNAVIFDPEFFDRAKAPGVNPANGQLIPGATYDPINGLGVGGDGFPDDATSRLPISADAQRLFRGLSQTIIPWQTGWGPRASFAYDLFGDQTTVVRGGYGRYFERIQGNYIFSSVNNPPFVASTTIFGGNVENPSGGATRLVAANIRSFDKDLKLPKVDNWSLGVQRKLSANTVAEATYVGTRGFDQTLDVDLNQLPVGALPANPGVNANALRPYPGYAFIQQYATDASFHYNSLQTLLRMNLRGGNMVQLAYTYSKAITTATDWNSLPVDSYNPGMDEGLANYDRPHIFIASYIYELPFWRDGSEWYKKVLGDWRISGVTTAQSGLPLNIIMNGDVAGIGRSGTGATGSNQRPNLVGDPNLSNDDRSWSRWLDTTAFATPAAGTFGNLSRNAIRGPGTFNTDLALHKLVPFGTSRSGEFRIETFNVFNHANPFTIGNIVGTAQFGQVTAFSDPRIVQLSFRVTF